MNTATKNGKTQEPWQRKLGSLAVERPIVKSAQAKSTQAAPRTQILKVIPRSNFNPSPASATTEGNMASKDPRLHPGVCNALSSEEAADEVMLRLGGSSLRTADYQGKHITTTREFVKWHGAEGDKSVRSLISTLLKTHEGALTDLGLLYIPAGGLETLTPILLALGEEPSRYAGAMSNNRFSLFSKRTACFLTMLMPTARGKSLRHQLQLDIKLAQKGNAKRILQLAGLEPFDDLQELAQEKSGELGELSENAENAEGAEDTTEDTEAAFEGSGSAGRNDGISEVSEFFSATFQGVGLVPEPTEYNKLSSDQQAFQDSIRESVQKARDQAVQRRTDPLMAPDNLSGNNGSVDTAERVERVNAVEALSLESLIDLLTNADRLQDAQGRIDAEVEALKEGIKTLQRKLNALEEASSRIQLLREFVS